MLRIAICDDDADFLDKVKGYAVAFFQKESMPHSIAAFTKSEEFWEEFDKNPFQLVLLDIMLPGLNGIELSRRIYARNPRCATAFISSSPDFALDGYGVNAVRYILKPLTRSMAHGLFADCLERLGRLPSRYVLLKMGGVTRKVDVDLVSYLESRNKYVHAHCDAEVIQHYGKLGDLLPELPAHFVQVHKSYAVNLMRIRAMSSDAMTTDAGESVPISRLFRHEARRRYLDYIDDEV